MKDKVDFDQFVRRAIGTRAPSPAFGLIFAWATWLRVNRGLALTTIATYVSAVAGLAVWASERGGALDALTAADLERWVQELALFKHHCATTRAVRLTAARQFFCWREQHGAGPSPARHLRVPKRPHTVPRKFSTKQLQHLFAACDTRTSLGVRNLAMLLFMYTTGARIGEMTNVDLADLEMSDRVARVRFNGKGAKERLVTFDGPAVTALRGWLGVRDGLESVIDHEALWIGLSGKAAGQRLRRGGIENVFARAGAAAGIPRDQLHAHKMRTTFATDLYDEGVDIESVRILLGHADIRTTRRYLAVSETARTTRMPAARQREVLGIGDATPRWLQTKMRERGMVAAGDNQGMECVA